MSEDPLATLRSFFVQRWYCAVAGRGSHDVSNCIPQNPHNVGGRCSYRWIAPPLYDTKESRKLLGHEPDEMVTPTASSGTRVLTARRIAAPQMSGVIASVNHETSAIEIAWDSGVTTVNRYRDLGVTWVFAPEKEEGEHAADP